MKKLYPTIIAVLFSIYAYAIGPVTGVTSLCVGATTSLADTSVGGTWSCASINATVSSLSGVVTGTGAGTAVITYTIGGVSATIVVTVSPAPSAIGGISYHLCEGQMNYLSNAVPGGTWTSSDTTVASIVPVYGYGDIQALSAGTSTVTYSLSPGCFVSGNFTVNPLPAAITGSTDVCVGASTTLSDATPGGSWQTSFSYCATVGLTSGVVTGSAAGSVTISYIASGGCATAVTVSVVNPATPVTGVSSLCTGLSSTLHCPGSGTWTSSNLSVATIGSSTGVVTGASAGTAVISYTVGGCPAPITATLSVLGSISAISGPSGVCLGSTSSLENASGGGTWTSSSPTVASIDPMSGVVSGLALGSASILYNAGGCGSVTKVVTVNPVPPAMYGGVICGTGSSITIPPPVSGGTWSTTDSLYVSVGATTGVVTNLSSFVGFSAHVTYTLPTGCGTTTYIETYPSPPEMTGCNNIGVGDTINFTAAGPEWYSTNSAVATVNSAGKVTGVGMGSVTIYNVSGYAGCRQATKNITVTSTAHIRAITGYDLICAGTTTMLSSTFSLGTWTSSTPAVATVSSTGIVTGISGGWTMITYSATGGENCIRPFYVNPLPPVITPASICSGDTLRPYLAMPYPTYGNVDAHYFSDCSAGYSWGAPFYTDGCYGDYMLSDGVTFTCSDTTKAMPVYGVWITGVSAGTVIITSTEYFTHCSASATFTVSPVSVAPITGADVVCVAGTATLADITPGGTWTSSSPSSASVGSSTGIVTGLATGVSSITYSDGSACGRAVTHVTVNPLPAAIAGGGVTICTGSTTTITDAVTGGTWTSSNPSVATAGSGTGLVTGVSAGTATITYTLDPCGSYVTTTVNVISGALPFAASNMCTGTTGTLSGLPAGGVWSSSSPAIVAIGSSSGSVTAGTAGNAVITYSVTGCTAATATVSVFPFSPTISGPATICLGYPGIESNTLSGGIWSCSNPLQATIDATGLVTGISAGVVAITYTLPTGCAATRNVSMSAGPYTGYSVTGGGSYCTGGTGVPVGIDGSQAGTNYRLYNGTTAVGSPMPGTYSVLNFGLQTATGVYSVIATDITTGCASTMTGTVNVSTVSSPAPITGTTAICRGYSTTLLCATPGGTWSSSNPSVAYSGGSTGYVYGSIIGTATIYYTVSCGVVSTTVNIDTVAAITSGSSVLCSGNTTTLTDITPGGQWVSGNVYVATVGSASGILTGVAEGSTIILYETSSSCYAYRYVTINPTPVIMGASTVCIGDMIVLSSSGGTWSTGTGSIASVSTSGYVTGISSGTSIITYTHVSGCQNTFTVAVTPACSGTPTGGTTSVSDTAVCSGTPVTLSISGSSVACGLTYQWQQSTNGTTWTNMTGANSPSCVYAPIASGYFRCGVSCGLTGATGYSSSVHVSLTTAISSHYAVSSPDTSCNTGHFYISACGAAPSLSVTTWFGDGTSADNGLPSSGLRDANVYHSYTLPGTYTVKQVLYSGTMALDSVTFSYDYLYCLTLSLKFYQDFNSNCVFDGGDNYNLHPVTVEIDSNGYPIDTITVTSGLYQKIYGPAGSVYAFKVLSVSGGRVVTCPATAIVFDTILAGVYAYPERYVGISCGTSTAFDLEEHVVLSTTTTRANATIYIDNAYCNPETPTVTMNFSPKYFFYSGTPAPASVVGNTVTWNLPALSDAGVSTLALNAVLYHALTLTIGDTVHSDFLVTPLVGDWDTLSNYVELVNTITASYDPNEISVSPAGNILPCTTLQYSIRFENTGNDTAHNIHILDTLSNNLDPRSLKVVMASAAMNLTLMHVGSYNIAKFDFPGINLLDSSHHGLCDGALMFSIKAKNPLADGVTIAGRGGILFDDNPVVMTNVVTNTIGISPLVGPSSVCTGASIALSCVTPGGTWTSSNAIATVAGGVVHGVTAGNDTIAYIVSNGCASRSSRQNITVNTVPFVGPISGAVSLCQVSSTTLVDTTAGGEWSSSNASVATIGSSSGTLNGISAGSVVITYTKSNTCGNTVVTSTKTVNPLPAAISGTGHLCIGGTSLLADGGGGTWTSSNSLVATVGSATGMVTGIAAGNATITYQLTTGCNVTMQVTVDPQPLPIAGTTNVCVGATTVLSDAGGGTWISSDTSVATIGSASGTATGVTAGAVAIAYTLATGCSVSSMVTVNPLPSAISGIAEFCIGSTTSLTDSGYGAWISSNTSVATIGSATGIVAGVDTGSSTITYTLSSGCSATAVLTVDPLPSAIAGNISVCIGGTITLTDATSGGTWASISANAAIGSASGILTGVTSGTATISYTLATSCATRLVITINPLPAIYPLTGGGSFCAGGVGVPVGMANSEAGAIYQLYFNSLQIGTPVIGTGSPISFGLQTARGAYKATALNTITSCSVNLPDSVVINIVPVVVPSVSISSDAPDTLCSGTTVHYTAVFENGGSAPLFLWKMNNAVTGADSTYSNVPVNGDVVSVTMISSAACAHPDTVVSAHTMNVATPEVITVAVTAAPGLTIEIGKNDTFTAVVSSGGNTPGLQWYQNNVAISGATSSMFMSNNLLDNDIIKCATEINGLCIQNGADSVKITIKPTELNNAISLLPNPNRGQFTITGTFPPGITDVTLEIIDILGQLIYRQNAPVVNGALNEQIILERDIAPGMYLIKVNTRNGNRTVRFVVE